MKIEFGRGTGIHSWPWEKHRECTAPRFLLNPYCGCTVGCIYCYTRGYRGCYEKYWKENVLTVFIELPNIVKKQLSKLLVAHPAFLSPTTDPFQPVEEKFKISHRLILLFIEAGLPVSISTKRKIPLETLRVASQNPKTLIQVSINTPEESLHRKLHPNASPLKELFENIEKASAVGLFTTVRIDPIVPGVNDKLSDIEKIIKTAKNAGAKHVVVSCLDIPVRASKQIFKNLSFFNPQLKKFYTQVFRGYLHAEQDYRLELFKNIKQMVTEHGLTFSLCNEFVLINKNLKGLNETFMTSPSCEGPPLPVYIRKTTLEKFSPAQCNGACLYCRNPVCGIKELATPLSGKLRFTYKDYLNFSKLKELDTSLFQSSSKNTAPLT